MADWDPSVNEIFLRAIEAGSPSERTAVLDRSCRDDAELRRKVEALLFVHDGAGSFLEHPSPAVMAARAVTGGEGATLPREELGASSARSDKQTEPLGPSSSSSGNPVSRPLTEGPGTRIGPYKLLEQIGEGGMGVVYMAEQEAPVRRKIALKIIKPGMDTGQVVARFEAERQALALMDHPNIAKVFDAGATGTGRPYFVMELVNGVPMTEYCDEGQLTPQERLELFVPVCRAIQHAHQKGIIHRDVKPSNVLVTIVDGRPTPKVIDFGVAKATSQALTERSLFTQFGAIVGTLEYMSPEQAALSSQDVDTRSDVFSLGVLLYELLTGSTPLVRARLREAGYAEILRRIREEEPPRPSARLSDSGEALPTIAARRHTEPAKLTRIVRGELDWIVMKALEKDRTRRYESAAGFARDVERYLADEAVEACPPSRRYRLRKFARKNRGALATAAAFAAVLLVATAVSGYLALRARSAEGLAKSRLAESEQSRDQAKAVSQFMVEAFRKPDPGEDGRDLKVVDLLDAAAARLDGQFAGSPAIRGALLNALGETYGSLGIADQAVKVSTRAFDTLKDSLGPDHPETLLSRNTLVNAYRSAGRTADAVALAEETLRLRTARLGPDHPDTLRSRSTLAISYWEAGRAAESIALHEGTLELATKRLGPDHDDTLNYRNNLAGAYVAAGRLAEGTAMHEEILELTAARFAPDHPNTVASRNNLAVAYFRAGKFAEAITLQEESLRLAIKRLGPEHPDTIKSRNNLAKIYFAAGRRTEGLAMLEEVRKLLTARLGPDHPETIDVRFALASGYFALGQKAEGLAMLEEVVKLRTAKLGPDHPATLEARASLGEAYRIDGRMAEAIAMHEQTLKLRSARSGPDAPETLDVRKFLGEAYRQAGRYREAIALNEETLRLRTAKFGPEHPETIALRNNLAVAKADSGQAGEAIAAQEELVKKEVAARGPDDIGVLIARSNLAESYRKVGRLAEAIPIAEDVVKRVIAAIGHDNATTLTARNNLAAAYQDAGRKDEAIAMLREVVPAAAKMFGPGHPNTIRVTNRLSGLYEQAGRWADGESLYRESLAVFEAKQPDHWGTFQARSLRGACLAGLKQYDKAEPLIVSGYEGMKSREASIPPADRPRLAEAAARVVRLYEGWGKPEKAEDWRRKLGTGGPPAGPPAKDNRRPQLAQRALRLPTFLYDYGFDEAASRNRNIGITERLAPPPGNRQGARGPGSVSRWLNVV